MKTALDDNGSVAAVVLAAMMAVMMRGSDLGGNSSVVMVLWQ